MPRCPRRQPRRRRQARKLWSLPSIRPVQHIASWLLSFFYKLLRPRLLGPRLTRERSHPQLPHVKNLVRRVSSWSGVRDCCEERLEEGAQKPRQPAQEEAEVVAGGDHS